MAPLAAALRLSVVFLLFVVVPTDSANRRKTHHHVARRKGDEASAAEASAPVAGSLSDAQVAEALATTARLKTVLEGKQEGEDKTFSGLKAQCQRISERLGNAFANLQGRSAASAERAAKAQAELAELEADVKASVAARVDESKVDAAEADAAERERRVATDLQAFDQRLAESRIALGLARDAVGVVNARYIPLAAAAGVGEGSASVMPALLEVAGGTSLGSLAATLRRLSRTSMLRESEGFKRLIDEAMESLTEGEAEMKRAPRSKAGRAFAPLVRRVLATLEGLRDKLAANVQLLGAGVDEASKALGMGRAGKDAAKRAKAEYGALACRRKLACARIMSLKMEVTTAEVEGRALASLADQESYRRQDAAARCSHSEELHEQRRRERRAKLGELMTQAETYRRHQTERVSAEEARKAAELRGEESHKAELRHAAMVASLKHAQLAESTAASRATQATATADTLASQTELKHLEVQREKASHAAQKAAARAASAEAAAAAAASKAAAAQRAQELAKLSMQAKLEAGRLAAEKDSGGMLASAEEKARNARLATEVKTKEIQAKEETAKVRIRQEAATAKVKVEQDAKLAESAIVRRIQLDKDAALAAAKANNEADLAKLAAQFKLKEAKLEAEKEVDIKMLKAQELAQRARVVERLEVEKKTAVASERAQIKMQASKNLNDLRTNIATDKAESDAETTRYVEEKRRL
jgi:hypothetical protein